MMIDNYQNKSGRWVSVYAICGRCDHLFKTDINGAEKTIGDVLAALSERRCPECGCEHLGISIAPSNEREAG